MKKSSSKNKNSKLLQSFSYYCSKHPEERFWQALRNWAKIPFLMINRDGKFDYNSLEDTFYFINKNK